MQVIGVADAELRKLRHDFTELLTRAIQPALWLLIFGQVMMHARGVEGKQSHYLDFLAPGILSQSVLFVAIFYGINTIWERDAGILNRYLVSPAARSAVILGKALSSSVRGLSQATVVYALSFLLGVRLSHNTLDLAGVILFISLAAGVFSTFSVAAACVVRTRERFLGIGQALTMPIFFASNAIYPLSLMPHWLQVISRLNPLTYEVDAIRRLMLARGFSNIGLINDFFVLVGCFAVLVVATSLLFPRMGE
jgi:ABC-2 type transport system permease protein